MGLTGMQPTRPQAVPPWRQARFPVVHASWDLTHPGQAHVPKSSLRVPKRALARPSAGVCPARGCLAPKTGPTQVAFRRIPQCGLRQNAACVWLILVPRPFPVAPSPFSDGSKAVFAKFPFSCQETALLLRESGAKRPYCYGAVSVSAGQEIAPSPRTIALRPKPVMKTGIWRKRPYCHRKTGLALRRPVIKDHGARHLSCRSLKRAPFRPSPKLLHSG